MAITLKDIAKIAKVSEATVSMVLNDKKGVSEKTRIRIKNIAKKHGYTANIIAQSLSKKRSKTIGLIVPDISNEYYGLMVKYIDGLAKKRGYSLIIEISNDSIKEEQRIIDDFIAKMVTGVIISPINSEYSDTSHMEKLNNEDIPWTFISGYYAGIEGSCVMTDLRDGSYKIAKYLLNAGHKNIYLLCGSDKAISTSDRISGYSQAFKEKGLIFPDDHIIRCKVFDFDAGYMETKKLIQSNKKIDAIMAISDYLAVGALKALIDLDIKVPDDISVTGFDNMYYSEISLISITTASQDVKQMSHRTVEILFDNIVNKKNSYERIMLDSDLIIRKSTSSKQY